MGSFYVKGDTIVHFSSSRCTGETFVLTERDLSKLVEAKTGRWWSPKRWAERLHKAWVKTPWGQQWLQLMGWGSCQCKVCE